MRATEIDGGPERNFLISAITDTSFLGRVAGKISKSPLRSEFANVVWDWCLSHYLRYKEAPGEKVLHYFGDWARKFPGEKDKHKALDRFLSSLSGQYGGNGEVVKFGLDRAQALLNEVQLERLQEEISVCMSRGELEKALQKRKSFREIDLSPSPVINVLDDEDAQREALENRQKVLVKYPGQAGEFFGEMFSEDSFVGLMAPAKGGKSFALLDIAFRAVRQKRTVAYFQVGDLSRNQIMLRFQRRAANRPIKRGLVRVPTGIVLPEGHRALASVEHKQIAYDTDLTWERARAAWRKFREKYEGRLRLSYHPTRTVDVNGIGTLLSQWDDEGHVASVVIIDYAGNLAPIDAKAPSHEQTALSWALMRQISEKRKCLVVTANQSNSEGFSSWVLTRKHFADSKMILAHVTDFLGVNMTDEEKKNDVLRYNFVLRREGEFSESYCLYCASCLAVANPIVVSCLPKRRK